MDTKEKSYLNKFNFGSFLNLCFDTAKENYIIYEGDKTYPYKNKKKNLPRLVFSCFLSQQEIDECSYATSDYARSLYSNEKEISSAISSPFITKENFDTVLGYVKKNLIPCIDKYDELLVGLAHMAKDESQLSDLKYDDNNLDNNDNAVFVTKCLIHTFEVPNRIDEVKAAQRLRQKLHYEKGKVIKNVDNETTIQIRLHSIDFKNLRLYHNMDTCLTDIKNEGLIIIDISSKVGYIDISVQLPSHPLVMRKLPQKDYNMAICLLEKYANEFRPKIKWNGLNIAQLVQGGLEKRKWMPYGYYKEERLIGYIDYKIGKDGIIEIGTLIVDEDFRDQGIGASLINFIRLKFFSTSAFSGTYEENKSMISTFKKTGFHEYNIDTGTNKRRERINPQNPSSLTNSVYYITNPILKPLI